ncbi:hypothetical protein DL96DRAFT_789170 [Flagelloscypha sp. PMI_526]|nr:hypothetical protein DL96DRAFT_789170 [Flagelloscypha sp. PMI_526]
MGDLGLAGLTTTLSFRAPVYPGESVTSLKPESATSAAGQKFSLYQAIGLGGATFINGGMWTRRVAAGLETWRNEFRFKDWTRERVWLMLSKCEMVLSGVHADTPFRGHDGTVFRWSFVNPMVCRTAPLPHSIKLLAK